MKWVMPTSVLSTVVSEGHIFMTTTFGDCVINYTWQGPKPISIMYVSLILGRKIKGKKKKNNKKCNDTELYYSVSDSFHSTHVNHLWQFLVEISDIQCKQTG